jgi:hypothetical protein
MTGPQTLSKRLLQRKRSSISSFNYRHLLVSLRSSSSCLHPLPRLMVTCRYYYYYYYYIIIIITIIIIGWCEVLTGVLMKIQVFLNVTPCRLVNRYRHLKKSYCLRSASKYKPATLCNIAVDLTLLLLLLSSALSPLCRVSIHIFLRQTMSLGDTLLQLFCLCCLWYLYF